MAFDQLPRELLKLEMAMRDGGQPIRVGLFVVT
jgi:hypothetical protein